MVDIYNQFKDFKSLEVVFSKNGVPQKIFCSVKSIENDRIILDANNHENKDVYAIIGNELKLHIFTENGIYSAVSKVLNVKKGLLVTEYEIAYPIKSKHSQRREYFRADMHIDFKMDILSNEDNISIEDKTANICGKGMSFVSDKPFPEFDSIGVELVFKEKIIATTASLVYSKQIVVCNRPKYIHAFTFTSISQRGIDFIVKKCFLHQLKLRKKQNS